jgi:hypothetical protein
VGLEVEPSAFCDPLPAARPVPGVSEDVGATGPRLNGFRVHLRLCLCVGVAGALVAVPATNLKGGALVGSEPAGATSMNGIIPFRGSVGVGASAGFEAVELGELGLESSGSSYLLSGGAGSVASAGVAAGLDLLEFNSVLLGGVVAAISTRS